jgi:RNA polymerase sigma-70 factor, ECF subfamily
VDYTKLDDARLIELIVHSQTDALAELYDRYNRLVYGLAFNAVRDQAAAEEITQDVFMRVWNKAATYRSEQGKVITWLANIARYRSIDILRHQKIRPEGHSLSWDEIPFFDPPDSQNVEAEVEQSHEAKRIRRALSMLPKEQCDALALAYFRGYTQEKIAEVLGEPLGTVKTRIRLGMLKLRQILQQDETSL